MSGSFVLWQPRIRQLSRRSAFFFWRVEGGRGRLEENTESRKKGRKYHTCTEYFGQRIV
jgi:hypothetical protein